MSTDELKNYIVTELGLGALPPTEQDTAVEAVAQNILSRIILSILNRLPDDDSREKFVQIAESGDLATIKQFARTQIEGFDAMVTDEIQKEVAAHKEARGT